MLMTILISATTASLGVGSFNVVSIGDGDTLRVKGSNGTINVRLACIDAPESSQGLFGKQSRQELLKIVPPGSSIKLKVVAKDRYGRTIAEVIKDGLSVNQHMVASGNAFVYWEYIQNCDRQTYSRLESEARLGNKGVWVVPAGIIRPWDYRKNRTTTETKPAVPASSPAGIRKDPFSPLPGNSQLPKVQPGPAKRYTCNSIASFSLAQVLLKEGHSYLDRDNDGIACEALRS